MATENTSRMVVFTAVGTLQEADVLRVALAAAGIEAIIVDENISSTLSHMGPAIHPQGIRVAVREEDVAAAEEIVGEARSRQDQEEDRLCSVDDPSPDDCAQRAYWAAWYSWWLPPIIVLTFCHFVEAASAQRSAPVENPRRFRRHMIFASVVGILLPILATAVLVCAILS